MERSAVVAAPTMRSCGGSGPLLACNRDADEAGTDDAARCGAHVVNADAPARTLVAAARDAIKRTMLGAEVEAYRFAQGDRGMPSV